MTILSRLESGPKRYHELLDGSREQLDRDLRILCKEHKIILRESGVYELWPIQPPDNPIMAYRPRSQRNCLVCDGPVYRYDASCCSNRCAQSLRKKPRPPCGACGKPCSKSDHKFCSEECRKVGARRATRDAGRQRCRKCGKYKNINQFPAACRGYPKSLCYSCVRNAKETTLNHSS